jgi:predicted nucleotidyltransferase
LQFLVELIIDLFVYGFIDLPFLKSKLEKNIEKLKSEEWFKQLEDDARYSYIIWNNRKVKRFLVKDRNIRLLRTDEQVRNEFIDLVKHEHVKYVGRNY